MAKILNCGHLSGRPVNGCPQCAAHKAESRGNRPLLILAALAAIAIIAGEAMQSDAVRRAWQFATETSDAIKQARAERRAWEQLDQETRERSRQGLPPLHQNPPGPLHPPTPTFPAFTGGTPMRLVKGYKFTPPPYPAMSMRLGEEGKVKVRLCLGADGKVDRNWTALTESSGYRRLDQTILDHSRSGAFDTGFRPATDANGQTRPGCVNIPFKFMLKR